MAEGEGRGEGDGWVVWLKERVGMMGDVEGWIVWLRERAGVRVMGELCG